MKKVIIPRSALSMGFLIAILFPILQADAEEKVRVDFFFVPGCEACRHIRAETLPNLAAHCTGRYALTEWDLNEETNYFRLVEIQERAGRLVNEPVYMVVADRVLLSGLAQIQTGLLAAVQSAKPGTSAVKSAPDRSLLQKRMTGFGTLGVFVAGLADGFNPCAIGSLVFMMGLLAAGRVKGRVLALAGALFCLSSFATYFLLGLGLLESLRALAGLAGLRKWLNWGLSVVLLVMAILSFRDAWRFRKGKDAESISLKMPEFLRERIKQLARNEIRTQPIVWAALVLGCVVTLIESVCTGQVYVPTLAWVAREAPERGRALGLLALYNLGFILPLAGVFGAVLGGTSIFSLLGWQQRHVVRAKIALGMVFVALALALAVGWQG